MIMDDLLANLEVVCDIAGDAGRLVADRPVTGLRTKRRPLDLVCDLDLAADELIVGALRERYPGDAILSEESGRQGPSDAQRLWIVDPLDGSTNRVRGIWPWGSGICCVDRSGIL